MSRSALVCLEEQHTDKRQDGACDLEPETGRHKASDRRHCKYGGCHNGCEDKLCRDDAINLHGKGTAHSLEQQ